MKETYAAGTNILMTAILIFATDFFENYVEFDIFLNVGILVSLFVSSTLASSLNDGKLLNFYLISVIVFTIIVLIALIYFSINCHGLACLAIPLLLISIPITAVIYAIGTVIGSKMSRIF